MNEDKSKFRFITALRQRPGICLLSTDSEGAERAVRHVLLYSIEEQLLGHATFTSIIRMPDSSYIVQDDSIFPLEKMEDRICGISPPHEYTADEDYSFWTEREIELRKLHPEMLPTYYPLAVINGVSEWFFVSVRNGGYRQTIGLVKGIPNTFEKAPSSGQGTEFHFRLDAKEIFETTDFNYDNIRRYAAEQMALFPNLSINCFCYHEDVTISNST